MPKTICIICGKKATIRNLPFGQITVCNYYGCSKRLFQATAHCVPVINISLHDFVDRELLDEKLLDLCDKKEEIEFNAGDLLADIASQDNGLYVDTAGFNYVAVAIEKEIIESIKEDKVPLILTANIKSDEAKEVLERRLKS